MTSSSSSSMRTGTSPSPTGPSPAIVNLTNNLTPPQFVSRYLPPEDPLLNRIPSNNTSNSYNITLKSSKELTAPEFEACFKLIESTSSSAYKASSVKWQPRKKKTEMKEANMRYLLLRKADSSNDPTRPSPTTPKPKRTVDADGIVGFLSFQITFDDDWEEPVLYIYEIHLDESMRGKGIGGHMMHLAEVVARRVNVAKVQLTVFTSNAAGRRFYERLGYEKDKCSPEDRQLRNGVVKEADYQILTLDLAERAPSYPEKTGAGRPVETLRH